jgi:long-chain acyl-CoA synthetase
LIRHPDLTHRRGDETPAAMFEETVARLGERPLLHSFTAPIAASRVAELVAGLAGGLAELGVARGDRVALYLQNDPQFVIAMLAVWRIGAIAMPCNPMLRERELVHHLDDAGARAIVTLDELHRDVAAAAVRQLPDLDVVVTTARCDPDDPTPLGRPAAAPPGAHDLVALAATAIATATASPGLAPEPDDVAVLTYTSGTTGPPKGAMNTHRNIAFGSRVYRDCWRVDDGDTILGIAPLYHVTGLTGHIGVALASGASLVLAHRFDPAVAARLTAHHRATVTIAAITAYTALAGDERARRSDLASLRSAYSGGAPIPPSLVESLKDRLGVEIQPVYGLTETTGPTNLGVPGVRPPVDPGSGALAAGIAAPETSIRILDDDGAAAPSGAVGEVAIKGPQVVPRYWGDPEEARGSIVDGELRTGDVGRLDEEGWLYLVDRRKDMIVASGFKVWPREVEDVLYEHPAVREAAVIGVPDSYRGETVWAFVSLEREASAEPEALIDHCRERLAAYKYPRGVRIVEELPKTPTGKILRRELRREGAPR